MLAQAIARGNNIKQHACKHVCSTNCSHSCVFLAEVMLHYVSFLCILSMAQQPASSNAVAKRARRERCLLIVAAGLKLEQRTETPNGNERETASPLLIRRSQNRRIANVDVGYFGSGQRQVCG